MCPRSLWVEGGVVGPHPDLREDGVEGGAWGRLVRLLRPLLGLQGPSISLCCCPLPAGVLVCGGPHHSLRRGVLWLATFGALSLPRGRLVLRFGARGPFLLRCGRSVLRLCA
jgi:hypothetical protein